MRRFFAVLVAAILVAVLPMSAAAVFLDGQDVLQYIADQADLLSDQEHVELEYTAQTLSEDYGCDVLIALVDSMDGAAAGDYAAMLNSGTWWNSEDAILFLLAMEEREWYIATFGDGIYTFTDYGIDMLGEAVVPYMSEGRYYDGFSAYLRMLPDYFQARQADAPIDDYAYDPGYRDEVAYYPQTERKTVLSVLPISLVIGLVAAAITLLIMRSAMNTRRKQRSAEAYLEPGSYDLRLCQDIFLYSNLVKTPRQQNTGGSGGRTGGGSSIHRSSGGRSHGGRGGKF